MAHRLELRPPWNLLLAALMFVVLDALLFKTGYTRIVSPISAAGGVAHLVRYELRRQKKDDLDEALVVGDSGVTEGFAPAVGEATFPNAPLRIVSGARGDITPRATYYLLRALDRDRNKYRMVVVPLHFYRASADGDTTPNDGVDIDVLAPSINTCDYLDFAFGLPDVPTLLDALAHGLLGSVCYAEDFRDFVDQPVQRMNDAEWYAEAADRLAYLYSGRPETMLDFSIDPVTRAIHFPKQLSEKQRKNLPAELRRLRRDYADEMTARSTAYMRQWLGRIVSYYRGSGTLVVFLRMPTEALKLRAIEPLPGAPSVVEPFTHEPGVEIIDPDLFSYLERPEYFFDPRHLNEVGRAEFSKKLYQVLLDVYRARRSK